MSAYDHEVKQCGVILRKKKTPQEVENERLRATIAELQAREMAKDKSFKPIHDLSKEG